jgi:hypothetical protein
MSRFFIFGCPVRFRNWCRNNFGSPVRCKQIGGGVDHHVITDRLRRLPNVDFNFFVDVTAGCVREGGPESVRFFYIWVPSSFSEMVSQQFWVTSSL